MLMTNAKKIVGIVLLSIGVIIIIWGGIYMSRAGYYWSWGFLPIITGVFLFVIGLVFLMTSRKKISAANAKNKGKKGRIVGIILLLIGLIIIISSGIFMYMLGSYWSMFVVPPMFGVVLFVIGLVILARKKPILSQVKPLTE